MPDWRSKQARSHRTVLAHAVLLQLQDEARRERHLIDDDDTPHPPECPLASAQSRRAAKEVA